MEQTIVRVGDGYDQLDSLLESRNDLGLLLVAGKNMDNLPIFRYIVDLTTRLGIRTVRFSGFTPNPQYEEVVAGIRLLNDNRCRRIVAVGGGSALDVAKCIKLYADMDHAHNYLEQTPFPNDIELIAVPTTAGTGSEATRFAVIYAHGEKQSISDTSCVPSVVVMDSTVLDTLPIYQKKATMMDALCHAVESFWSVNATTESQSIAREAIKMILEYRNGYLDNTKQGNAGMLYAANLAGRAINITQTTAGHAMCYKLTTLYGISHGHAAALCVSVLFSYMSSQAMAEIDTKHGVKLGQIMRNLADCFGCNSAKEGAECFTSILDSLELSTPRAVPSDISVLCSGVNPVRLKNHPIALDIDTIEALYNRILDTDSVR